MSTIGASCAALFASSIDALTILAPTGARRPRQARGHRGRARRLALRRALAARGACDQRRDRAGPVARVVRHGSARALPVGTASGAPGLPGTGARGPRSRRGARDGAHPAASSAGSQPCGAGLRCPQARRGAARFQACAECPLRSAAPSRARAAHRDARACVFAIAAVASGERCDRRTVLRASRQVERECRRPGGQRHSALPFAPALEGAPLAAVRALRVFGPWRAHVADRGVDQVASERVQGGARVRCPGRPLSTPARALSSPLDWGGPGHGGILAHYNVVSVT
jgi:hypothetical protein